MRFALVLLVLIAIGVPYASHAEDYYARKTIDFVAGAKPGAVAYDT
jgi:hypothetical protein